MQGTKKIVAAASSLIAVASAAVGLTAIPAHAATAFSYQTPVRGGLLLNASKWGGEGSKAATIGGHGVVNDPIDVWSPSNASVASDFVDVPVTGLSDGAATTCSGAGGCFLIEYAPAGNLSGLCVSTVTDVKGAYARLRGCAPSNQAAGFNQWQDFAETQGGDALNQLQAVLEPTPYVLNDKAYGGNGSQVISWSSTSGMGSENQLWEVVPAA